HPPRAIFWREFQSVKFGYRVRGRRLLERRPRTPVRLDSIGEQLDLSVGERPATGFRKRGHGCTGSTMSNHSRQLLVGNNRRKEWIVERRSGSHLTASSVAA